jgi:hypothetical protein
MSDISVTQEDVQAAEQRENEILQQTINQHLQQRVILLSAELTKVRAALAESSAKVAQAEERAEIERLAQEANHPEEGVTGTVVAVK